MWGGFRGGEMWGEIMGLKGEENGDRWGMWGEKQAQMGELG